MEEKYITVRFERKFRQTAMDEFKAQILRITFPLKKDRLHL